MTTFFSALSANEAAHLSAAIDLYQRTRRLEGLGVPGTLIEVRKALADQALRSSSAPSVTEGHPASIFAAPPESSDGDLVTDTSLLTYGQAAVRMRCSLATVKRRIAAGELIPVRHGRICRLSAADVAAFIESKTGA